MMNADPDPRPDERSEHLLIFAHGKESGPWGTKIRFLAEVARRHGFAVLSPDYRQQPDPDRRVEQLLAQAPTARGARVLAGSSMGGYVSAMAAGTLAPDALFLIAPALYFPGYDREPPAPPALTHVVHGWGDDIVTPDKAIRYARRHRVPLTLLDAGHTLNEQLPELGGLLDALLVQAKRHAAYRCADYRVDAEPDVIRLAIGRADPDADAALARLGVRERWALVTACNPYGEALDDATNAARHQAFLAQLQQQSLRSVEACGHDPGGHWRPEAGRLLIDPPAGAAEALGRLFEQNAIVTGQPGAAPRLVWLR